MDTSSHYAILDVDEGASHEDIKRAYRKLSLKYHPDRNKGSAETELYKRINEAYETIGDPAKRELYDQSRPRKFDIERDISVNDILGPLLASLPPKMRAAIPISSNSGHINIRGGFHPQEGMFFGMRHNTDTGNGNGNGTSIYDKPAHIIKQLQLTFEQSCRGISLPVDVERTIIQSNGTRTCERETVYVKVHQGVDDGEIIVVKGRGNATPWIQSDIRVIIGITNDTPFKRRGLDLLYVKTISLREALCGVSFEIRNPAGRALGISTLNRVVSPAFEKRIIGFGVSRAEPETLDKVETGDLILTFDIQFPATLTAANVEALGQIL